MAKRYSGTLQVTVSYVDADESYTARIVELNDDARFEALSGLRLPPAYVGPVDSADAYDRAARAALGFASADDDAVFAYAESDDSGEFTVRRRK